MHYIPSFAELAAPVAQADGVLKCEQMKLGEADASGRRSPVGTGEFFTVPCDLVIENPTGIQPFSPAGSLRPAGFAAILKAVQGARARTEHPSCMTEVSL